MALSFPAFADKYAAYAGFCKPTGKTGPQSGPGNLTGR
jgi:hypothetical protein